MKKVLFMLSIAALFTACGGGETKSEGNADGKTESTSEKKDGIAGTYKVEFMLNDEQLKDPKVKERLAAMKATATFTADGKCYTSMEMGPEKRIDTTGYEVKGDSVYSISKSGNKKATLMEKTEGGFIITEGKGTPREVKLKYIKQ